MGWKIAALLDMVHHGQHQTPPRDRRPAHHMPAVDLGWRAMRGGQIAAAPSADADRPPSERPSTPACGYAGLAWVKPRDVPPQASRRDILQHQCWGVGSEASRRRLKATAISVSSTEPLSSGSAGAAAGWGGHQPSPPIGAPGVGTALAPSCGTPQTSGHGPPRWRRSSLAPPGNEGRRPQQPNWVAGRWPVLTQIVHPAALQGRCPLPGGLRSQVPGG